MSGYQDKIQLYNAYSVNELVLIFKELNQKIKFLDTSISLDILPISKLVREYSTQVQQMLQMRDTDHIKNVVKECNHNIEVTITNLQVHDAISQKLDHIHIFHTGLINDLMNLQAEAQIPHTSYLSVCGEIIEMNKEQLLYIKAEYESAVLTIQRNLRDTQTKTEILIAKPALKIFQNYPDFEKVSGQLVGQLLLLVGTISPSFYSVDQKTEKLKSLATLFTMESERKIMLKVVGKENVAFNEGSNNDMDQDQAEFF